MAPSDEALAAALKAGHRYAFRALYERHKDRMLRLALRITGERADAEDAVQEAFLVIFEKAERFDGRSSFATWLYRITVNASLQVRRRRGVAAPEGGVTPLALPADPERAEALRALDREVQALPLRQRMVFTLHLVEGFSLEETAAVLGIAPGTARYHLFAARNRLQERLAPYLPEGAAGARKGTERSVEEGS